MPSVHLLLALLGVSAVGAQTSGYPRDPGSGQPAAVQPIPKVPLETLIEPKDHPAAAVRGNQEGTVKVRLTVTAGGKVSDCAIRQSSGAKILDTTTCTLLVRRARFTPALDAAGKPTEGQVDHVVSWKITDAARGEVYIQLPRKVDSRVCPQAECASASGQRRGDAE